MNVVPFSKNNNEDDFNPLDQFEDLIEASGYDYDRATFTRLHFQCSGKHGDYAVMLEWNDDVEVVKCSLIINATQKTPSDKLESAVVTINESAWHGFFMIDGVGNSVFKTLISMSDISHERSMFAIEESIDRAVADADRLCISLALSNDESHHDLFDHDADELDLLFSDIKGNA